MTTVNSQSESVILTIEDDTPQPIEVELSGWTPAAGPQPVRIVPSADDTSGQSLAGGTRVSVIVYGEDVEGQAMTLRFPTPGDAAQFQRKLMLTGALAGTLAAASIGASTALNQSRVSTGAAADVQPAPAAVHDTDKLSSVAARDTDKLTVAVPRAGNVTPDISRVGDAGSLTAEYAASHGSTAEAGSLTGRAGNITPDISRMASDASASAAGDEAAARAAQAAAGGASLGGGTGSTDEPKVFEDPNFRGR